MRIVIGGMAMMVAAVVLLSVLVPLQAKAIDSRPSPGQMFVATADGRAGAPMPLERTEVNAQVSGFGARVTLKQHFRNPSTTPIEAIYTFPMPHDAAIDSMNIRIGDRLVVGEIKRREEARQIYEAARAAGRTAALLDQERPNIFTQSVANLMPGKPIDVEISYVQVLKYDGGEFEFAFPMVVGPRYVDESTPDPSKISPPVTPEGTRSGQNVSIRVSIDAGAPIQAIRSVLHEIDTRSDGGGHAVVSLRKRDEIPNRDFVLRYRVATNTVQSAFLTHYTPDKGGFFSLILLPPKAPSTKQISPKEVIFVMDQSGSQMGFPIEKSKELTLGLVKSLHPGDTFNVIGFNTSIRALWDSPQPLSARSLNEAATFVKAMTGNGGTNIREGVVAALSGARDPSKLRIVLFNTDGYVGDEKLVLDAIKTNRRDARMFTFGIGNAVNRYLIDSMSQEGKGAAEYVTTEESADKAIDRFIRRLESPVLTDVSVSTSGIEVTDALPEQIPDVFDDSPVVLFGRYARPGTGTITIRGKLGGKPWAQTLDVVLPGRADASAVPTLWARRKVEALERQDYLAGFYTGIHRPTREAVEQVALDFGIMSQYTSFVAVDQKVVNIGGVQRTVRVPVEMPYKVSYEGVYGAGVASKSAGRLSLGTSGGVAGAYVNAAPATLLHVDQLKANPAGQEPEDKIARSLRGAKGLKEVMVAVSALNEANHKKLQDLGAMIEGEEASSKILFVKVDAGKLLDIAKLEFVQRIDPIG